ncbi:hypothetical protein HQ524_00205 [Candidatus Uhrbacteria bacterium]|nr:hypothetical protein [Candidatus Uhrbacteria bacterium]
MAKKVNPPLEIDPLLMSLFSYVSFLAILPLIWPPKDATTKFHARQGLALFIAEMLTAIVGLVPLLGWFVAGLLGWLWVALSIYGIFNVLVGRKRRIPIVGMFVDKIKV